jgi:hypothetical protein
MLKIEQEDQIVQEIGSFLKLGNLLANVSI